MAKDGILGWFADSPDIAPLMFEHWIVHDTDLSLEDLAPLKTDFENIYRSVPDLASSSFTLENTLQAYFKALFDLEGLELISIKLDRKNVATGYGLFVGSERNLLHHGAYEYHASPLRLAERYERLAVRYGEDSTIGTALLLIADELATTNWEKMGDVADEIYFNHYLIYLLEERDPRVSELARYFLEWFMRIIKSEDYSDYDSFFDDVFGALPALEAWRDDPLFVPEAWSEPVLSAENENAETQMLLLAYHREHDLFEAFIDFFDALGRKGYFAEKRKEFREKFADMPDVANLLTEVTDQVLFSQLSDADRSFLLDTLQMMAKSLNEEDRSTLDDYKKHGLNTAASIMLSKIKKDRDPGSAPPAPGTPNTPAPETPPVTPDSTGSSAASALSSFVPVQDSPSQPPPTKRIPLRRIPLRRGPKTPTAPTSIPPTRRTPRPNPERPKHPPHKSDSVGEIPANIGGFVDAGQLSTMQSDDISSYWNGYTETAVATSMAVSDLTYVNQFPTGTLNYTAIMPTMMANPFAVMPVFTMGQVAVL